MSKKPYKSRKGTYPSVKGRRLVGKHAPKKLSLDFTKMRRSTRQRGTRRRT